jgi:hypothetical protein
MRIARSCRIGEQSRAPGFPCSSSRRRARVTVDEVMNVNIRGFAWRGMPLKSRSSVGHSDLKADPNFNLAIVD